MDDLEPRWLRYGLSSDPFFSNPLDADTGTNYPIELFQGRKSERKRLGQAIVDSDHSATLIHAGGGHGKTTLANAVCFDLTRNGYAVLPEEIQFRPDAGFSGFLAQMLHAFLQALSDRGAKLPRIPDDGNVDATDFPNLAKARLLVQMTRVQTGAGLDVSTVIGGGGSSNQFDFLQPRLDAGVGRQLVDGMVKEAKRLDKRLKGFVVRLNELDVAAAYKPKELRTFLDDARNLLQVPGMHFIMMGSHAVWDTIDSMARVRTEFAHDVALEAFSLDDVTAILTARYKHLRGTGQFVDPVAPGLVAALHDVHFGDLRNILRDLRRAVTLANPVEIRPVTKEEALPLLEAVHYRDLEKDLGPEGWETLNAMEAAGKPIRQKDLAAVLNITEPGVNQRFKPLRNLSLIDLVQEDGRSQYFRLQSRARLAVHEYRRRIERGEAPLKPRRRTRPGTAR